MSFQRSPVDRREVHGPFDIIGDVHGCGDELEELLAKLGHEVSWAAPDLDTAHNPTQERILEQGLKPVLEPVLYPANGRRIIFVGDLVDRGPRTPDVLRIAMQLASTGQGFTVNGNHDNKLMRWLSGKEVKPSNGLQASIDQMSAESEAFRARCLDFLENLPTHLWLDGGDLVVAHAGIKEDMIGREDSDRVKSFTLYGDTSGEKDEYGYPVRRDWAAHYSGKPAIIYGHVAAPQLEWLNNTICLDTGCVFGGQLTALRWPERELVQVQSHRAYYDAKRPLAGRTRR